MAALLGNLLGTVDGLLGGLTGSLDGDASTATSASAQADLSHTLDLGAIVETSPSIDLGVGLDGIDASVSAPTLVGANADVGDVGGLLHGLV